MGVIAIIFAGLQNLTLTSVFGQQAGHRIYKLQLILSWVTVLAFGFFLSHQIFAFGILDLPSVLHNDQPLLLNLSLINVIAIMLLIAQIIASIQPREAFSQTWPILNILTIACIAPLVYQAIMRPGLPLPVFYDASKLQFLHLVLSFASYGILLLVTLLAARLALQHHHLQSGHLLKTRHLPPLEIGESILIRLVKCSLVTTTLSLVTGIILVYTLESVASGVWHKLFFTALNVILLFGLCVTRKRSGISLIQQIYLTLAAVLCLFIAYFGTQLILEFLIN